MKKLVYIFTLLLVAAGLSSCKAKIENPTINNLVGTWDLVSDTIISGNTETTTKATNGDYLVITESTFTSYSGNHEVKYPFSFANPHLYLDGVNSYDLVSLSYNQMVLKTNNLLVTLLGAEHQYTYKRRQK